MWSTNVFCHHKTWLSGRFSKEIFLGISSVIDFEFLGINPVICFLDKGKTSKFPTIMKIKVQNVKVEGKGGLKGKLWLPWFQCWKTLHHAAGAKLPHPTVAPWDLTIWEHGHPNGHTMIPLEHSDQLGRERETYLQMRTKHHFWETFLIYNG